MDCPVCHQEMQPYKEEPCSSKRTNTEYRRTYYRCLLDDTWGRLEVPIGIICDVDPVPATTRVTGEVTSYP